MTNRDLVHSALKRSVFPFLLDHGFEGTYPHFRRSRDGAVELISFQPEKTGGAFYVETAAAFPEGRDTNLILQDESSGPLTVFSTKKRYRLPGMYQGGFFYADVYQKATKYNWWKTWRFGSRTDYVGVPDPAKAQPWLEDGYICIRRFSSETPEEICGLLLTQLEEAFRWMEKFERSHRRRGL